MIINFDTNILISNKITAHQLVLAFMINEKDSYLLHEYLGASGTINDVTKDLNRLQEVKLIKGYNGQFFNFDQIKTTEFFNKLLANYNLFDELFLTYPEFVTRPNGEIDKVRVETNNARALYAKITRGNYHLHEHILQCLREELEYKERTNGMQYMKKLPRWIADNNWKNFEGKMKSTSESKIEYGTTIE
jgi:hypothetical protein